MEIFFFFQAEDGIQDAQESRGLGDVYKGQDNNHVDPAIAHVRHPKDCPLYTSDAADE